MNDTKKRNRKFMIVHAGRRDRYEVAKAFDNDEAYLVTDFYFNPKSIFGRVVKLMYGKAAFRRYRDDLDIKVCSSIFLFAIDLLERFIPRNTIVYRLRSYGLARVALRTAKKYDITDAVVYYNSGANSIFRKLDPQCRKILFQMHPHPKIITDIYDAYIDMRPMLRNDIVKEEEELSHNLSYVKELADEANHADTVICTSTFVAKSLNVGGIIGDRAIVIPYGVAPIIDINLSANSECSQSTLRLAFIGQFIVRKGVYELIKAMQNRPSAELTIFTRDRMYAEAQIIKWFNTLPNNISLEEIRDDTELWRRASQVNFLILPSLVEGYGLVLLEALVHGLPVIATSNTAALDLLKNRQAGILLASHMHYDIEAGIDKATELREGWSQMRMAAAALAREYSWERFRSELKNAIQ